MYTFPAPVIGVQMTSNCTQFKVEMLQLQENQWYRKHLETLRSCIKKTSKISLNLTSQLDYKRNVELQYDVQVGSWFDIQIVDLVWTSNRCPELVTDRQTRYRHDLHVYPTSNV